MVGMPIARIGPSSLHLRVQTAKKTSGSKNWVRANKKCKHEKAKKNHIGGASPSAELPQPDDKQ
jgi:hypothetical protein